VIHEGDAEDMGGGDAVFEGVGAAGVFGDVAAEGGDGLAAGIGGEVETVGLDGFGEFDVRDAGLGEEPAVGEVNFEDLGKSLGTENDAAESRHCASGEAGSGSARGEGDFVFEAPADDGLDFGGGFGEDDGGGLAAVYGVGVGVVGAAGGLSAGHLAWGEELGEVLG
jgi:hypothetical protein